MKRFYTPCLHPPPTGSHVHNVVHSPPVGVANVKECGTVVDPVNLSTGAHFIVTAVTLLSRWLLLLPPQPPPLLLQQQSHQQQQPNPFCGITVILHGPRRKSLYLVIVEV